MIHGVAESDTTEGLNSTDTGYILNRMSFTASKLDFNRFDF